MPALTANDVTVTYDRKTDEVQVGEYYDSMPTISFGNSSLTYPTNGVPLPAIGKLGPFRREIKRFMIEQPLNGYVYAYDATNHTIRIYLSSHDLKFIQGTGGGAVGIDGSNTELEVDLTGGKTIAGADAATKGGVLPSPLVEVPTTHAPAATTLRVWIRGQ